MKRVGWLFLLLCLCVSLLGCGGKGAERMLPPTVKGMGKGLVKAEQVHKYLVLGDSIAAHYGVEEKDSYESLLGEKLSENGESWQGENWGVNGAKVLDLVGLIREKKKDPESLKILSEAELITISIGGNDILAFLAENGVDLIENKSSEWLKSIDNIKASIKTFLTELRDEIHLVIGEIRASNPNAIIILQNIHNVARDMGGSVRFLGKELTPKMLLEPLFAPIRKIYQDEAKNAGYILADTYSAFDSSSISPLLRPELIHPNEAGHALIADILYKAFLEAKKG